MATRPGLQIEGLEDLRDVLKNVAPNIARSTTRQAVQEIASQVAGLMKSRVKRRYGDLAKSIKAIRRRGTPDVFVSEVRVGHDAPYGIMLEFGTRRTAAQPYIVPSTEQVRPQLPDIYREAVGKKLEKALARAARKGKT